MADPSFDDFIRELESTPLPPPTEEEAAPEEMTFDEFLRQIEEKPIEPESEVSTDAPVTPEPPQTSNDQMIEQNFLLRQDEKRITPPEEHLRRYPVPPEGAEKLSWMEKRLKNVTSGLAKWNYGLYGGLEDLSRGFSDMVNEIAPGAIDENHVADFFKVLKDGALEHGIAPASNEWYDLATYQIFHSAPEIFVGAGGGAVGMKLAKDSSQATMIAAELLGDIGASALFAGVRSLGDESVNVVREIQENGFFSLASRLFSGWSAPVRIAATSSMTGGYAAASGGSKDEIIAAAVTGGLFSTLQRASEDPKARFEAVKHWKTQKDASVETRPEVVEKSPDAPPPETKTPETEVVETKPIDPEAETPPSPLEIAVENYNEYLGEHYPITMRRQKEDLANKHSQIHQDSPMKTLEDQVRNLFGDSNKDLRTQLADNMLERSEHLGQEVDPVQIKSIADSIVDGFEAADAVWRQENAKKVAQAPQKPSDEVTYTDMEGNVLKLKKEELAVFKEAEALIKKNREAEKEALKKTNRTFKEKVQSGFNKLYDAINTQGRLRNALEKTSEGREVIQKMQRLEHIDARSAIEIREIDKEMGFDKMTTMERKDFNEYVDALKRISFIENREKPPLGWSSKEVYEAIVRQKEEKFKKLGTLETHQEKANSLFATTRAKLSELLEAGLISQKTYETLEPFDYLPFVSLEDVRLLLDGMSDMTVQRSLNQLNEGAFRLGRGIKEFNFDKDAEALIKNYVVSVDRLIAKNKQTEQFHKMAEARPDNPFFKTEDQIKEMARVKKGKKKPNKTVSNRDLESLGYSKVTYVKGGEDGGKVEIPVYLTNEIKTMLEWTPNHQWYMRLIRNLSGVKLVKSVVVNYNPLFSALGAIRDTHHAYMATGGFGAAKNDLKTVSGWVEFMKSNAFVPKAIYNFTPDFARAIKSIWTDGDWYKEYMNEGGAGVTWAEASRASIFMDRQKQVWGDYKNQGYVLKAMDGITRLNASIETAIRMATMKQLQENGVIRNADGTTRRYTRDEAISESISMLDFKRKGPVTEALDTFIPFANATIRATEAILKAGLKDKARFSGLMVQYAIAVATIRYISHSIDPEADQDIPIDTKNRGWTLPISHHHFNAKNEKEHFFLYVKKEMSAPLSLIDAITNSFMDYLLYDKLPDQSYLGLLYKNAMVFEANQAFAPTLQGILAGFYNFDLFTGEKVYKGPEVEPEFERSQSEFANTVFGDMMGFSPARTSRGIQKLIPIKSNPISALTGWVVDDVIMSESQMTDIADEIVKSGVLGGTLKKTSAFRALPETLDEAIIASNSQRAKEIIIPAKDMLKAVQEKRMTHNEARIEARKTAKNARHRKELLSYLNDRLAVERQWESLEKRLGKEKLNDLMPPRVWWEQLLHRGDGKSRANEYYNQWVEASPQGKTQMRNFASRYPGFASQDFWREFNQLRRQRQ